MITSVTKESAKKVITRDLTGKDNGFLIELFKEGVKTTAYLTCAKPGSFKGYHLHKVRAARYVCIRGKMKIIVYIKGIREEHILSEDNPERLFIPAMVPTGLENIGSGDGWLINYPDPPYDPDLKGEQVDFTQQELDSGEYRKKL